MWAHATLGCCTSTAPCTLRDLGREAAGKPLAPQQLAQALAVVQQHSMMHMCVQSSLGYCTSTAPCTLQDLGREAGGKPLAPQQLAQALAVVQALADVVGASGGGATAGKRAGDVTAAAGGKQQELLLVPDDGGVLRPAAELAYDDAPWLDAPTAGKQYSSSSCTVCVHVCTVYTYHAEACR